jgi:hypothetical protein
VPDRKPATGLLERVQLGIADAEERAAQDGDQRQRVLRIRQRPQQHRQSRHLLGLAERAGAAHLDRDVQRLECGGIRRDVCLLLAREDQEVAVTATAGIHLAPDVARDAVRVRSPHLLLIAVIGERKETGWRFLLRRLRIERSETWRVLRRFGGELGFEHAVRPLAQLRDRSEIRRQRENAADRSIAEAIADDVVDLYVCPPEAINRLLRVSYNK